MLTPHCKYTMYRCESEHDLNEWTSNLANVHYLHTLAKSVITQAHTVDEWITTEN